MIKKLEIFGVSFLVIIGIIYGGFEVYLRKFAPPEFLANIAEKCHYQDMNFLAKFFYKRAAKTGNLKMLKELAELYYADNDIENCIYYFEQAAKKDPNYFNYIGMIYYKIEDIPQAIKWHQKAANKNDIEGIFYLREIYKLQNNIAQVENCDKKLLTFLNSKKAINVAYFYYYYPTNEYSLAAKFIKNAIKNGSKKSYSFLGKCYFRQQQYQKALAAFEQALKIKKDSVRNDFLAKCYFKNKNYSQAIKYYKKALKEDYFDAIFVANLCAIYQQQKMDFKPLIAFFKQVLKEGHNFKDGDFQIIMGYISSLQGKKQQAQKYFAEAISIYQDNTLIIAELYKEAKNYDEAIKWCQETKKTTNNKDQVNLTLAEIFKEQKQYAKAVYFYEKAFKPSNNRDALKWFKIYEKLGDYETIIKQAKLIIDYYNHYSIYLDYNDTLRRCYLTIDDAERKMNRGQKP